MKMNAIAESAAVAATAIPQISYTSAPAIDAEAFPDTKSDWYWTSTISAWSSDVAWVVGFFSGGAGYYRRDNDLAFARAVRASALRQLPEREGVEAMPRNLRQYAGEWPERFACNGPEGTFWADDAELANKLIAAAFDRDEWTVTDTQDPTP